jgi:hypothetical protein
MINNPHFRIFFFWGGGMKVQIFPTCVIPAWAESEEDAEDCIRADVIEGIRVDPGHRQGSGSPACTMTEPALNNKVHIPYFFLRCAHPSFRLINTRNRSLRAPPHRSFAAPLREFNNTKGKLREKSHFRKKIRESVTASLLVQFFNNATAGGTVNIIVS